MQFSPFSLFSRTSATFADLQRKEEKGGKKGNTRLRIFARHFRRKKAGEG